MQEKEPTLFERVVQWIKDIINKLRGMPQAKSVAADLEYIEGMLTRVYNSKDNKRLVKKKLADEKYSYAGPKSKTHNFSLLEQAIRLYDIGKATSEDIRQQTGWFKGYDGKWRYEISDRDMEIDTRGKFHSNPDIRRYTELVDKVYFENTASETEIQVLNTLQKNLEGVSVEPKTLGELIKHDKLFAAYPQLKDIKVHFESINERGIYDPIFKEIYLNKQLKLDKTKLSKTLIHEIQHAIQDIEGFTGGSNPEYWHDAGIPEEKAREYYEKTAGEIEARDAASRYWRTDEARKETRPDIDRQDVVFANSSEASWQSAKDAKYDSEIASISQQIKNSQAILNKMDVVGEAIVPDRIKSKYDAAQWAISQLKSFGYQVDRQNFGKIYFDEKDIRHGAEYADTYAEKGAFVLIPKVLKRGIEIGRHGDHKLRQKATVTFAAPVILNGIRGNMAVVVNLNGNRYLVHRIILPDGTVFKFSEKNKEVRQESYQGVTENSSLADTTSLTSKNSISNSTENVNTEKSNDNSNDTPSGQYSLGSPIQQMRYNPEAYAKHLNRKYQSKADKDFVAKKIKQIVAQDNKSAKAQEETRQKVYDREGNLLGELTLKERLINEVAVEIAESIEAPLMAEAEEILSGLKEKPLRVNEKQEGEIKHQFGTLTNFRKETGIRLVSEKSEVAAGLTTLENAWNGDWVSEYAGWFDSDVSDVDMPIRLAEIVNNLNGMTEELDIYTALLEFILFVYDA